MLFFDYKIRKLSINRNLFYKTSGFITSGPSPNVIHGNKKKTNSDIWNDEFRNLAHEKPQRALFQFGTPLEVSEVSLGCLHSMKNFEKNFFFWLNLCQYRITSVNTRRIKSTFRVMKRYNNKVSKVFKTFIR